MKIVQATSTQVAIDFIIRANNTRNNIQISKTKSKSLFNSTDCQKIAKTETGSSYDQVASTKKVFVINSNITEVFWGLIGYVKSKKPNNQSINPSDSQHTKALKVCINKDVDMKSKNKE